MDLVTVNIMKTCDPFKALTLSHTLASGHSLLPTQQPQYRVQIPTLSTTEVMQQLQPTTIVDISDTSSDDWMMNPVHITIVVIILFVCCICSCIWICVCFILRMRRKKDEVQVIQMMPSQATTQSNIIAEQELLAAWMEFDLQLPQYYPLFVQHGYDSLDAIKVIENKSQLKDIGVNATAHQIIILKEIKILRNKDAIATNLQTMNTNSTIATGIRMMEPGAVGGEPGGNPYEQEADRKRINSDSVAEGFIRNKVASKELLDVTPGIINKEYNYNIRKKEKVGYSNLNSADILFDSV